MASQFDSSAYWCIASSNLALERSRAGSAPALIERSSPPSGDARRETYIGVYECVVRGQRVVSDRPCGASAQARTLIVDQPDPREATRLRQQQWQSARAYSTPAASGSTATVATESANAGACAAVDQAIEALNARMRQAYSSSEGEYLRDRWHALKERRYSLKCGR